MSEYRIRAVDPLVDYDALFELNRLHGLTFDSSPEGIFSRGFWWLVHRGDEAIAFAGLHASISWKETGYLARVGVLDWHRGNGLQGRLIKVREAMARRLGWATMVTETRGVVASSNSLIKRGYRLYEPKTPWAPNGSLYWRKWL